MILNQTTINNAIAKAKCCLANKTIEYFDKLSIGIDKDCLFKESIVLKGYIDTLSNFQIVGSKTTCDCCIGGNYNFQIDDSPLGQGIQFLCDGTGYTIVDGVLTEFKWGNDVNSNKLYIDLPPTNIVGMSIPIWQIIEYYVTIELDVIFYVENDVGILNTEDFIEKFNNPNAENVYIKNTTGITVSLSEDDTMLIFTGPPEYSNVELTIMESDTILGNPIVSSSINILSYTFDKNCNITVTGSNQMVLSSSSIQIEDIPDENTSCTINILNLDFEVIHTLEIPFNVLEQPDEVVDYWNENSNTNFILTYADDMYTMYSDMFGNYINYTFEISYTTSEEEETQDAVFEEYSSSYNLKTEDPCESKIISQTCLTNKQVISIIQHINKICKNC